MKSRPSKISAVVLVTLIVVGVVLIIILTGRNEKTSADALTSAVDLEGDNNTTQALSAPVDPAHAGSGAPVAASIVPTRSPLRGATGSPTEVSERIQNDQPTASPTEVHIADREADILFSQPIVPVFRLSLLNETYEELQRDALLEEYVEAQLEYEGVEIGAVGLRYKGSSGTLHACFDETGTRICDKLSMKIKFHDVDKNLRFFGLKKLNFHSMKSDKSKIAEKISYKVFRDAGIAAPRSAWARLEINGESLGLFTLVEQIDGRFTKDRFQPEGDGDLYKEAWPTKLTPGLYEDAIKTNEDEATHDKISRFAQAMTDAAPQDRLDALGQWTDLDSMYTFMAVQDAVAQWDGVTAWYCFNENITQCSNHNFYLYSQETTDFFTLVPWDMDSNLIAINPTDHIPHWTNLDVDCDQRYEIWDNVFAKAPSCDPILGGLASNRTLYSNAVDDILGGAFNIESILADIDGYVNLIRDEVANDLYGGSFEKWISAVEGVRQALPVFKLRLDSYRNGESTISRLPFAVSANETNTFEGVSDVALGLGVLHYSNPETTVSLKINREYPLSGESDVRVDFTYRDGLEAWSQWMTVTTNMAADQRDLNDFLGVRLNVKSDTTRELHVGLVSQPNEFTRAKSEWIIRSESNNTQLDLLFADMSTTLDPSNEDFTLQELLQSVVGLNFASLPNRPDSGLLGDGVVDSGFLQIDNIEFF